MSHHLDSPASRRDPRLNVTDVYAFDRNDATVLTMIVNTSLAGPGRTAGFHPEGRYEFKIHFDGAATEQLTYRFSFGPADASGAQHVAIDRLAGTEASADRAAGARIAEGDTGEAISDSGVRAWCGAAADPFYLDLHHLAHILKGLQDEQSVHNGEWIPAQAANSFTGSQICAIVLEIPNSDAELRPGRTIGVWAAARLATDAGGWRQVNRAGSNTGRIAAFAATAVRRTGGRDPDDYGRAVADRLLPDALSHRMGITAAFTLVGFNGRAPADNAPGDIRFPDWCSQPTEVVDLRRHYVLEKHPPS